jgi:geranylgeranyl pyrophosphate synthase
MQLPLVTLPLVAPQRPSRAPQANIPPTRQQREYLRRLIASYVDKVKPVPPMPLDELRVRAEEVIKLADIDRLFIDYVAILINNEAWKEHIAAVPFERRLLMLPKCLRDEERCPAPFDEFGLLCKQCGLCSIQDLQNEAERLGYAVLTAEGSAIVTAIIETGKIDAIVGVSCLSVLERAFPYMEAAAIPGVAIPLLQDDCKDTNLDIEWLWELIHLTSEDQTRRLDLDALRKEVESWFTLEELNRLMGPANSHPEQVARRWLAKQGKRWRPFLAVCAFQALALQSQAAPIPDGLKKLAIAVECFHKASLIHDDIEDDDSVRYDEPTLHAEHGVAIALNIGDLMLGDGYRLIAECGAAPQAVAKMLAAAAAGHRQLAIGQGQELHWLRNPSPVDSTAVIDIFRRKTAPAFEVALKLGAIYASAPSPARQGEGLSAHGVHEAAGPQQPAPCRVGLSAIDASQSLEDVLDVLHDYSESLGIAYQIKDDLDDFEGSIDSNDIEAMRLSICLAIGYERARHEKKEALATVWSKAGAAAGRAGDIRAICDELQVQPRARSLHEAYKEQAVRSLRTIENANLKGLLRRVVTKIFDDLKIEGWCREYETRNAAGRPAGAEPAA